MKQFKLSNVDSEDIEDAIFKIEESFNLKFEKGDFSEVKTFGEFSDIIIDKIQLENIENCTTQQAFYKIRKSLKETFNIENIKPEIKVEEIFPKKNRIQNVKKFEKNLGFKANLLKPHSFTIFLIFSLLVYSVYYTFQNWKVGLSGILIAIIGFKIADIFGKELQVNTIGELSEKITRENYINSRSNSNSFNKKEIEAIIIELFCEYTGIERDEFNRNSSFI